MIPWQEYDALLRKKLSPKRYRHSVAVMERAVELAKRYGVDVQKAKLAGLLHDVMKNEDKNNLLQFIRNSDILLSVAEKNGPPLWHAIGDFTADLCGIGNLTDAVVIAEGEQQYHAITVGAVKMAEERGLLVYEDAV